MKATEVDNFERTLHKNVLFSSKRNSFNQFRKKGLNELKFILRIKTHEKNVCSLVHESSRGYARLDIKMAAIHYL